MARHGNSFEIKERAPLDPADLFAGTGDGDTCGLVVVAFAAAGVVVALGAGVVGRLPQVMSKGSEKKK